MTGSPFEAKTGWLGRKPKGFQDTNSFKAFCAKIRGTKEGQDHLARHHKGFNPKGSESADAE